MFTNKVVLITGAARGIGFEIGKQFAEQGAEVILTDRDADAVENAAESLRKLGFKASGFKLDVTSEEQIIAVIKETEKTFGRLDILINNAGLQYVSFIEDFPTDVFEKMIRIMLTAPFMAIKHVLPLMKKQGGGRIINIASMYGVVGFAGKAAYSSAKHGVIGLTKAAALEAAPFGITVNALCPGYVDTALLREQLAELAVMRNISKDAVLEEVLYPLIPQRRLLEIGEVAAYAMYLAGEQAKGITGQAVVIDGGYTAQ
ncbi:3-hydroxybutyrate dehydrogenase [Paenibacillus psychroresistens]|uniref:3-hydroxybutyrate dehydrogenase n=1 Tax=Paenibacillus psychroresistens TaxID=1778678 RepID=A0A6B8RQ35_9BACL|nr:3-hydroxybutyrate dehydrogenase [Paenibacillus psychroresistens]QGQ97496.1 3-hydroxybutyrate dehydrogenase [Paenibacillus psychroresistens]